MRHVIPEGQRPTPLREYLPRALSDVPEWAVRRALDERQVKRAGRRLAAGDIVRGGEQLTIYLPKAALGREEPRIATVYEDARIWVVEKPRGIASRQVDDPRGAPGVLECLRRQAEGRGEPPEAVRALRLCHRLDHHTGGLLLLAKDDRTEAALRGAFERREIEKFYTCLVVGTPEPPRAALRAYLRKDAGAARVAVRGEPFPGASPIETGYRVLSAGDVARLEVRLITGRTHQIRAHLAHIGHPVLGDDKYGDRAANRRHGARRQMLWATRLTLRAGGEWPDLDGRTFSVEAPF